MGDKDSALCAVCCLQFSKSQAHSDSKYLYKFEKLNAAFTPVTPPVVNGNTSQPMRTYGRASNSFKKSLTSLPSICHKCVFIAVSALERKRKVVSLESEVRKLQVQILNSLRNLQGAIDGFKDDVSNVEELIKVSTGNVKNLDEFFLGRDGDGDSKGSSTALKDVIQYREKIVTVFEDLCKFSKKLIIKPLSTNSSGPSDVATTTLSAVSINFGTAELIDGNIGAGATDDDDGHHGSDENDNFGDGSSPSPVYNAVTFEDEDYGDNASDKSADVEMESNRGHSSDSAEEFVPRGSKKVTKQKVQRAPSILSTIDLTGMAPFKKALITRVITRAEKFAVEAKNPKKDSQKSTNPFEAVDPMKTHSMTYDTATDSISLEGFKITVNDLEEYLECSECGFRSKQVKGNPIERGMYDHILGHHLKLFSCSHCPSTLASYRRFQQHLKSHQNNYDCDICGKPLKAPDILRSHKWSHFNEMEKAEALKAGMAPPRHEKAKARLQALGKRFQCETCGKSFHHMSYLARHEQTHMECRNYMCTKCGKTYRSNNDLQYHLKYSCFPDQGNVSELRALAFRFRCDQCPSRFPYEARLKDHKRAYHSDNPESFKCSMCDKTFRTKALRIVHEKTHSDARPYECRKGCGATYKTSFSRKRHEKSCKITKI